MGQTRNFLKAQANAIYEKQVACKAEGHAHSVKIPLSSFPMVDVTMPDGKIVAMHDIPAEGQVFSFTPMAPPITTTTKFGNTWTTYAKADAQVLRYDEDADDSDDDDYEDDEVPIVDEVPATELPEDDIPF